ncbi:OmpA family protein [Flavobacteriaceae bacterium]|nr:OmpA family protein [Flavobacteriaceae bacterium]MDG1926558.1 OmpA family protein [Flavobacteriaceae bacterium]
MKKQLIFIFCCYSFLTQGQNKTIPSSTKALLLEKTIDTNKGLVPFLNNTAEDEFGVLQIKGIEDSNRIEFLYITAKKMKGEKLKRNRIRSNSTVFNLAKATIDTLTKTLVEDQLIFELNTSFQEGPATYDRNLNTLYFTRNVGEMGTDNEYQLNIFETSYPKELDKEPQVPIFEIDGNYSNMHPTFDSQEKTLYFSSDRPGGFGGMDLYKVQITDEGSLGDPQNMGPEINTSSDEVFPFIYDKGVVFFSRKRTDENGFLDLFMGQIHSEQKWVISQLKEPFLSESDDFGFSLDPKTKFGIMSSNRKGGMGKDDNYYFIYTPEIKGIEDVYTFTPDTLFVTTEGVSKNDQASMISEDPLQVLIDKKVVLENNSVNGNLQLNEDGSFWYLVKNPLILKDSFQYRLESKNNTSKAISVYLNGTKAAANAEKEKIEFIIRPIYYEFDKSDLWAKYKERFDELVRFLDQYPEVELTVKAYTDARGSADYNLMLSKQRANSIIDYLKSKMKNKNNIDAIGYGETTIENNTYKNYLLIAGITRDEKISNSMMSKLSNSGYSPIKLVNLKGEIQVVIETFDYFSQAKKVQTELKLKDISSRIEKSPAIKITEEAHQMNRRVEFEVTQ